MKLDRVTITGADSNTDPQWMAKVSESHPFVEWGILLSANEEGKSPRFPTLAWMEKLRDVAKTNPEMKLSGHLCGRWVRDLCLGMRTFERERPCIARMFHRVQLNFHAQPHKMALEPFVLALKGWDVGQYIFQADEVNQSALAAVREQGVDAVPLFDTSGGAGVEPDSWPAPMLPYSGYAGGLHPERLGQQLRRIARVTENSAVPIWIDVETHVRSDDDQRLVPSKVQRFLDACEPFVSVG